MPLIDAPSSCEHVSALAVAVGLIVGEFAPVSTVAATVNAEVGDDRWGPAISESKRENSAFCYFLILNSAESLKICRKIIIAPKILKNFV